MHRTPGDAFMQAGGQPLQRQGDQSRDHVITLVPGVCALGTGGGHGHRGGVDDGDVSGVGGTGDGQADFCRVADSIGYRVVTMLHSRVLVRSDESVVTLILYRPGPLYVAPPRAPSCGQLRTPKRE